MEFISQIINTTIESFDFSFCIAVNVLTYFIIKLIDEVNGERNVGTWTKRLVLLVSIILISFVYHLAGNDLKLIINSSILAPVFWSWIAKPICNKLNIDYCKDIDEQIKL